MNKEDATRVTRDFTVTCCGCCKAAGSCFPVSPSFLDEEMSQKHKGLENFFFQEFYLEHCRLSIWVSLL